MANLFKVKKNHLRGRTHIRIKGQNLNFYLENHATPHNIHATCHNIYFIRLRILHRIVGTLYWRVDDPLISMHDKVHFFYISRRSGVRRRLWRHSWTRSSPIRTPPGNTVSGALCPTPLTSSALSAAPSAPTWTGETRCAHFGRLDCHNWKFREKIKQRFPLHENFLFHFFPWGIVPRS